ncbi:MAG TPA: hypothetical protein VHG28_09305 [Longimicrobiaceae bacterium]|nr:hypothetical protein [Longimicrobiaceae bacterium]
MSLPRASYSEELRELHPSPWRTCAAAGVPATLIELPGVGHSVPEFSGKPRFRVSTCTTLAFLRERLRPGS